MKRRSLFRLLGAGAAVAVAPTLLKPGVPDAAAAAPATPPGQAYWRPSAFNPPTHGALTRINVPAGGPVTVRLEHSDERDGPWTTLALQHFPASEQERWVALSATTRKRWVRPVVTFG